MVVIAKLWQLILVVGLITSASLAAVAAEAMPGCPHQCGDVDIPYPFGTQKGCYLNANFLITCKNESSTNKAPTPYIGEGNIEVTNITSEGQIHVLQYIAKDCYSQNGSRTYSNSPYIRVRNFYISNTHNKLVAVGCDTRATVRGYDHSGKKYFTGCLSICNSSDSVTDSCSGVGCCEVSIPKGLWNIETYLTSYNNHTFISDFNPCSYAFVVDKKTFNFSASDLRNLRNITSLPLVLDWGVGNETCEVAQQNKSNYACMENSTCIVGNKFPQKLGFS